MHNIYIIITETRKLPKQTTEYKFFAGLNNHIRRLRKINKSCPDSSILRWNMIIHTGHVGKPQNIITKIRNILDGTASDFTIFILCDNEDNKVEGTREIIKKHFSDIEDSIIITSENSNNGYEFENFAGHFQTPPKKLSAQDTKKHEDCFERLMKKYIHPNSLQEKNLEKSLEQLFRKLANDKHHGQIFKKILEIMK